MDRRIRDKFDLRVLIPTDEAAREYGNYRLQRCLWHADEDPSLLVYRDGYRCQSCGTRGDVVDWLQFSEHLSFPQAIAKLQYLEPSVSVPLRKREARPPPPELADRYHVGLDDHALAYYHRRGITDESILRFRLGYGPPPRQREPRFAIPIVAGGILQNIKFRRDDACPGCGDEDVQDTGDRLVCNACGTIWTPTGPKYLGLAGARPMLFNDPALASPDVLIVEGEFDAIVAGQCGIPAVSSTGGARSFPASWAARFPPMQRRYAIFDQDAAGEAGRERLHTLFPGLRDVFLPVGHKGDVTDYILQHGPDSFRQLIQESTKWYNYRQQLRLLRRMGRRSSSPSSPGSRTSMQTTG